MLKLYLVTAGILGLVWAVFGWMCRVDEAMKRRAEKLAREEIDAMHVTNNSHSWHPPEAERPWRWCMGCGAADGGARGGQPCPRPAVVTFGEVRVAGFELEEPGATRVQAVGPCPQCCMGTVHRSKLVRPGRRGPVRLACTKCGRVVGAK